MGLIMWNYEKKNEVLMGKRKFRLKEKFSWEGERSLSVRIVLDNITDDKEESGLFCVSTNVWSEGEVNYIGLLDIEENLALNFAWGMKWDELRLNIQWTWWNQILRFGI